MGFYDSTGVLIATDGSVGTENMGAGWTYSEGLGDEGRDGCVMVMGSEEGMSSYRPELLVVDVGLEEVGDEKDADILLDSPALGGRFSFLKFVSEK